MINPKETYEFEIPLYSINYLRFKSDTIVIKLIIAFFRIVSAKTCPQSHTTEKTYHTTFQNTTKIEYQTKLLLPYLSKKRCHLFERIQEILYAKNLFRPLFSFKNKKPQIILHIFWKTCVNSQVCYYTSRFFFSIQISFTYSCLAKFLLKPTRIRDTSISVSFKNLTQMFKFSDYNRRLIPQDQLIHSYILL